MKRRSVGPRLVFMFRWWVIMTFIILRCKRRGYRPSKIPKKFLSRRTRRLVLLFLLLFLRWVIKQMTFLVRTLSIRRLPWLIRWAHWERVRFVVLMIRARLLVLSLPVMLRVKIRRPKRVTFMNKLLIGISVSLSHSCSFRLLCLTDRAVIVSETWPFTIDREPSVQISLSRGDILEFVGAQ